jgi:O-antigen biosynthesis protein WbqP
MKRPAIYRRFIKRLIDITLSIAGLIVFSPVFVLIAIWVKVDSCGPVLFRQKRIGKNKICFNIIKFRTMSIDAPKDVPTHLFADPQTFITRSGRILRKTSLDELPQIWNILIGKMSIVGPRPALWNQDDLVSERDKYHANDALPGLTGWAQINGRDALSIPDKARLDGEYVQRIGFLFDLRCFLGTILAVVKHKGVVEGVADPLIIPKKEMDA